MDTFILRFTEDATHPRDVVPIYLIHTIANPVCNRPDCWCQTSKAQIAQILKALNSREMVLAKVAGFVDGKVVSNG